MEDLNQLLKDLDNELNNERNKLINLLKFEDLENINLYNFYLKINDLLNKRKIIVNKIILNEIDKY